jgi:hypothetical protein
MKTKQKYFNIFENCYKFSEMDDQEQKDFLVKNEVYIKGVEKTIFNKDFVNLTDMSKAQNINFIGQDFIHKKENYTLNQDFLEEIFNVVIANFRDGLLKKISSHIDILTMSYNVIDSEKDRFSFINETKAKANQDFLLCLQDTTFQEFHSKKSSDKNIIKIKLRYDIKSLSDYIFGLENYKNCLPIRSYYSFLRIMEILKFCNSYAKESKEKEIEEKSELLDGTQKVLLIEKLLKNAIKWENTDDRKKAYIISKIIDRNPDNIRKTLAKSDKKLSENTDKFKKDNALTDEIINKLG